MASDKVAGRSSAEKSTPDKLNEAELGDKVDEITVLSHRRKPPHKQSGSREVIPGPGVGDRIATRKPAADVESALVVPDDDKSIGGKATGKTDKAGSNTRITARLVAHDDRSLTVTAGERTIHVELSALPTIKVELSEPVFVPDRKDHAKNKVEGKGTSGKLVSILVSELKGAKIVVYGTGAESKTGNRCLAKSIEITLSAPLTGSKPASVASKTAGEKGV